jgi:hypothetical protein
MEQLSEITQVLPEEYKIIDRIRDMWANQCTDIEIRSVLHLSKDKWKELLSLIKMQEDETCDNRIAYEKYKAKSRRRSKELEELKNFAIATDQLATAMKCMQLDSEQDRADVEVAQKLGVLQGEVIHVKGDMSHDVRMAALFANLTPDLKSEAEADIKQLVQAIVAEGMAVNESGKGTTDKG